ncbi:outer membrane beta-barrel protein [Chryseobacterium paludis]|uniref:outer membrane beta-barrel protein n=1 Tax=Chryseobacterium paludis TaxID=2956784 RepID=UPI0021BDF819|nr:outer membrane beta-barrel protein [Chryseobacterium paludis]
MFLRRLLLLFPIILFHFSKAQKKKNDTVYVYEKVIVYDTIYLEKPIKAKLNSISVPQLNINKTEIKDIIRENIVKNKTNSRKQDSLPTNFQYGITAGVGLKNSNWAKELSNKKQQFGESIGVWVSKNIITPRLSLMLSASVYYWNSTFDLDANKEDTYLNGFYFSNDQQPLLFQRFNNKHFEYALQLKIFYEWNNIRPFVGFLANRNIYKMQFLVPENNVLDKLDDFKNTQNNYGFTLGIEYRFMRRFLLSIDYQQYKMKNISLKNSSFDFDIFDSNNTFAERKINLGLSYIISK